nr:hypothetical protein [Gammaproteobacteria bacterium]
MTSAETQDIQSVVLDLVVTAGTQQGARISLRRNQPVSVGMRLDCDVVLEAGRVLADSPYVPGTEPVVRLLQNGGEVELEVQSGHVQLGRASLSPGDSGLLPAGSSLQIGESSIQLVPSVSDVPGFDVHPATAPLVQASPDAARQS